MRLLFKLFIGILMLFFFSCDYFCSNTYLNLAFVGFDSTDIYKIVLRKYKINTAFQSPIDTFLITKDTGNFGYIYTIINDTTVIYNNMGDSAQITNGYDWAVYIPSKNKTKYISNIERMPGNGKHGCLNPIISFKQDSSIITPRWISTDQFWTTGYRAYIYK